MYEKMIKLEQSVSVMSWSWWSRDITITGEKSTLPSVRSLQDETGFSYKYETVAARERGAWDEMNDEFGTHCQKEQKKNIQKT